MIEQDWTRGYREAWTAFRVGCGWWLLEYALHVMLNPMKREIARALVPICDQVLQAHGRVPSQPPDREAG